MNSIVSPAALPAAAGPSCPRLDHKMGKGTWAIFPLPLLGGLGYSRSSKT